MSYLLQQSGVVYQLEGFGIVLYVSCGGEREKTGYEPLALHAPPHTVGFIVGCDQVAFQFMHDGPSISRGPRHVDCLAQPALRSEFSVWGSECRVQGLRLQAAGFRVELLWFGIEGL